jgi:hypothetical protein
MFSGQEQLTVYVVPSLHVSLVCRLHAPPPPPVALLEPCLQTTPTMVVPHSGGSEGSPVQKTHRFALHAGGSPGGHPHWAGPRKPESSDSYCDSPATLIAVPPAQKQAPRQRVPVAMTKQSEF